MTITEVLNKTPPSDSMKNPFHDTYLKPELDFLQFRDADNEALLAQVTYLPSKNMQCQCHLLLRKDIYTLVVGCFPKIFGDKIRSF